MRRAQRGDAAPPSGVPRREVDRTPRPPHVALAHELQRSAGNAATARLLQRKKEFDTAGRGATDSGPIHDFVEELNKAAEKAYQYVLHVPDLGPFKELDGHTSWWVELWAEYQQAGYVVHGMPAAFGYAIESLATHIASPYRPPAPQGLTILTQQRRSGTNPDLILMRDSDDVAWIDLTSDAQAAHIYTRKIGWNDANLGGIHVAEISYPAMQIGDFTPTPNYAGDFDMSEYLKRSHFGKILTSWRRKAWIELGKHERFKPRPTGRNDIRNSVERPINIYKAIEDYFGIRPADDREAASILMAMGRNPGPHHLSRSGTTSQGEAFLIRHDPHLPTLAIPADGVPRPVTLRPEELELLAKAWEERGEDEAPPQLLADEEPGDELVAMEAEEQQPLAPVASFEFTFEGIPQVSPQMLSVLGDLLNRSGLSLAVDLESGLDRMSFIASGENFAPNMMQAFMNFEPFAAPMVAPALLGGENDEPAERRDRKRKWSARVKLVRKEPRLGEAQSEVQNAVEEQLRLMLTDK